MKIVNHHLTGVETIKVNEKYKKVIVEKQIYTTTRDTKTYSKTYNFGSIPNDIWTKIQNKRREIEERRKTNVR